jgi:hypothetical protein
VRGDNLTDLLDLVRTEAGLDHDTTQRLDLIIRDRFGGAEIYVQRRRKRTHLDQLQALPDGLGDDDIAHRLGVSERHARRLRQLIKK